ncbi:succinate dehydrogenase, hydrophobic membrane anchor protein [Mangrovicella endophytica]|uniref:succinate dehydrogenase, hydrophobic membrane anchor protein n=1 Tax=Mangrovicella endophytica TaxID=2066697 RepID=UPI000C9E4E6E|nr:succinate dehydrogenase, hydrophobic membrane anchor protein [Mangrovicella endophytica]
MDMMTPLRRVRGLGSAKAGTEHFWQQRLTAVSNFFLISFFIIFLIWLHDGTYADMRAAFANPLIGIGMALTMMSVTYHMRLGVQVVIEDYIHGDAKIPLLILNNFFAIAIAAASLFAIVKMSFGA